VKNKKKLFRLLAIVLGIVLLIGALLYFTGRMGLPWTRYETNHASSGPQIQTMQSWDKLTVRVRGDECVIQPGTTRVAAADDRYLLNLTLVLPEGVRNCQFGIRADQPGAPVLATSYYERVGKENVRAGLAGRRVETLFTELTPGSFVVTDRHGNPTAHRVIFERI
jgi:hypothetical protein